MTLIDDYLAEQQTYEKKYGSNTIVLMQVGHFYEAYAVDNEIEKSNSANLYRLSDIMNIQMTRKNKSIPQNNRGNPLMIGVNIFSIDKFVQIFASSILTLVFLYWAAQALQKWISEPLSSQVFYSLGDSEQGMIFPVMTICNHNPVYENPLLSQCTQNKSRDFLEAVYQCLRRSDHTLDEIVESAYFERSKYLGDYFMQYGNEPVIELDEKMWIPSHHKKLGLCYSLDLSDKSFGISESEGNRIYKLFKQAADFCKRTADFVNILPTLQLNVCLKGLTD